MIMMMMMMMILRLTNKRCLSRISQQIPSTIISTVWMRIAINEFSLGVTTGPVVSRRF
jgi:hypothetical protein